MALIQSFQFGDEHHIRVSVDDQGNPWWVALDVCHVLGLENVSRAVNRLDTDEYGDLTFSDVTGRRQKMLCVNEPGLYSLILRSNKTEANPFKRWITHEVLPTLRRTGRYQITDRDIIAGFLSPSFLPWEKRFELQFFQEVCRVYGQPIPTDDKHAPMMAWFISKYIYDILPVPVRAAMDHLNPIVNKKEGTRRQRLHQLLREERIKDFLTKRIEQILAVLALCEAGDKDRFTLLMARHDATRGIEVKLTPIQRVLLTITMPNQLSLGFSAEDGAA